MTSLDPQLSTPDFDGVAAAFAIERQLWLPVLTQSSEDKEKIAAGLLLCLSLAIGQTIDGVKIERIDRIYPPGRNHGLIDFKIVCSLPSQVQVDLGVCVLPFADPQLINEACNRLLVYKDFGLDRLCLLRQSELMTDFRQLPICLPKLLSADIGGHFVPLKSSDILAILVVLSVFQHKQQYELTSELIRAYLLQLEPLSNSELVKNLLAIAKF
jgi:hypothetical protein